MTAVHRLGLTRRQTPSENGGRHAGDIRGLGGWLRETRLEILRMSGGKSNVFHGEMFKLTDSVYSVACRRRSGKWGGTGSRTFSRSAVSLADVTMRTEIRNGNLSRRASR